jgi:hypothetical protein
LAWFLTVFALAAPLLVLHAQPVQPPAAGASAAAAAPTVVLLLKDGTQLTATVLSQSKTQVVVAVASFSAPGQPPMQLVLDPAAIASCTLIDPIAGAVKVADRPCAKTIHSGFQSVSIALGYIGSAQRDESAKGTVVVAGYQGLDSAGSFRGKTTLVLGVAYDDKWKATPLSSNVTQNYSGILTQDIFSQRTPMMKCPSDDPPFAYALTASAYHNNSQGIQVDQSYGFGFSKAFVIAKAAGPPASGCRRAAAPSFSTIGLTADLRSVNDTLYAPGQNAHGVGTQLQVSFSRTFLPSKQTVVLTAGGVPVYNNTAMSEAMGSFMYAVPILSTVQLLVQAEDNYDEIAPKTFNKNYLNLSIGIKYSPSGSK